MLVLSRKKNEETVITVPPSTEPRTIVVTPIGLRTDKVRLGFNAPSEVAIHRREVHDAIRAEQEAESLRLADDGCPIPPVLGL